MNLTDELINTASVGKGRVRFENEIWHIAQFQSLSQFLFDEAAGLLQTVQGLWVTGILTHFHKKNLGRPQIIANFDPGDRKLADPGIANPPQQNIRNLLFHQIGYPIRPFKLRHGFSLMMDLPPYYI